MSHTHRRGELSEEKVGLVLHELAEDSNTLLQHGINRILSIKHALPNSDLDQRHADFLVVVQTPELAKVPIPIQVKSSERSRRKFETRMDMIGLPHIRSVAVTANEELEAIREKVIQCLRSAIALFKRGFGNLFRTFNQYTHERDICARCNSHRPMSSKRLRALKAAHPLDYHFIHPCRMAH